MATYIETVNRIATELRRSNINDSIKLAINDAITEGAKTRFWFNEQLTNINLINGVDNYKDDQNLVTIDDVYYYRYSKRYNVYPMNWLDYQARLEGNPQYGYPDYYARYEGKIFLDPIPNFSGSLFIFGHGNLYPFPLVADADTNAWLTDGELYIRALAKRNVLRDVIRDYGEARMLEAVAEDYKQQLENKTAEMSSTGELRSTSF